LIKRVDLPLFQIPQGDDVEEGILLSSFLADGVIELQRRITVRGANRFSPVGDIVPERSEW
jgi:hypothetical protein